MLSICIPVYNTDCSALLNLLAKQIAQLEKTVEVLVCDDFSTNYTQENEAVCQRNGFSFFKNKENLGRIETRKKLISKTIHKWTLFLDADVIPKSNDFVKQYIDFIKADKNSLAIGGCCYPDEIKPFNLRLRYGRNREEMSAEKRQLNPYNLVLFGNVLMKKRLFQEVFEAFNYSEYGEDVYLSSYLKSSKIDVLHLPNKVFHLGIENNREFLKKIKKSGQMQARLDSNSTLDLSHIKLVKTGSFLKKYMLHNLMKFVLAITSPFLKTVLITFGGPLLFVDLMRLYYFLKTK